MNKPQTLQNGCQHIIGIYKEYGNEPTTLKELDNLIKGHIVNIDDKKDSVLAHFDKMFDKYNYCPLCGEKIELNEKEFIKSTYDEYINSKEYSDIIRGILESEY